METRRYYDISPLTFTGDKSEFTYHAEDDLAPGSIVEIPLGRRKVMAVLRRQRSKPDFATKAIVRVLDLPPLPPYLLELADWMSAYYASAPSGVWTTLLPSGIGKKRRPRKRSRADTGRFPEAPLTAEQEAALASLRSEGAATRLVQGVTGSGKTRLYLELARDTITAGRSVIVLVPEITLTPQLVGQFEAAFGPVVISTHSRLTEAERHLAWEEARAAQEAGSPRIVVGPRSSLFLPVHHLGLVIIDECHETSYKQEQNPRYHALAVGAWLAQHHGGQLVLGSATPGLTELAHAAAGRIGRVVLSRRANGQPAPAATVIDLRDKELRRTSRFITEPLIEALTDTLEEGRQSILFINRRGSASSQICSACGEVTACPRCVLPLTFHADLMRLICHHCDFRMTAQAVCSACGAAELRFLGGGTKRIEAEVMRLFPNARLARLDRDSATLPHIKAVYEGLVEGTIDILVGTQMIAKGLDLPRIDTVGIVSADTMLHLPDYTAAERTVATLSQVSGRAGRGDRQGRVYIQSYTPDHPAIQAVAGASYDEFARAELAERETLGYPPYRFTLKLTHNARDRNAAREESTRMAAHLRTLPQKIEIIGPAPSFLETVGGGYRWQVAVKAVHRPHLVEIARSVPDTWTADLDPINLL